MFRIILVVFVVCACNGQVERIYPKDACVWETFQASCSERQAILIRKALYGRMRSGRCFNLTSGEKPCYADVQSFVERHCGGRRLCQIKLTNENLKLFPSNCSIYSQKYLEIEYSCEEAFTAEGQTCIANQSILVTTSSGYLANLATDETGQGSQLCPWRFEPRTGQTVHLTLLDFGVWIDKAERDRRNICRIYATIKEIGATHRSIDTLVCGGMERERFIMSTDKEITIAMMKQDNTFNDTAYFFIKYQVFDCPKFEAPALAITERSGSGIRIFCQYSRDQFWDIKCISGDWTPKYNISCPEMSTSVLVSTVLPCPELKFPEGATVKYVDNRYMGFCSDGASVELLCINGAWTTRQTSACFDSLMSSTQAPTGSGYDQLKIFVIAGSAAFVALAVVVAIVSATVCCKRRRATSNKMKRSVRSHMNNSYYTAQLLPDQCPREAERARSGIYDTLDESRMQDVSEPPPLPSTSNFDQGSPRCAKTLQWNQKLEPWTDVSMERRCGTLPVHRPLPEAHEYTTPLKQPRDSTYLMPREHVYLNPAATDDSVKGKM